MPFNNMNKTSIFFLLFIWTYSYGQDGSDIRYFKIEKVDNTLIGKDIHFDFFNHSNGGKTIDTIEIYIDNSPIKFVEVRNDDGYNNWFSKQYLKSVDTFDNQTIRISKLKLVSISKTSFQVTMFIDYYNNMNELIVRKSKQQEYWFDKEKIIELLLNAKQ
jgi:hypothetical protein